MHRDLKLENVLFKSKGDLFIKVVDFGIAGVCTSNQKDKVDAGSVAYMPPEVIAFSLTLHRHLRVVLRRPQLSMCGPLVQCTMPYCLVNCPSSQTMRMR